jgi:hypothetical protein
LPSENTRRIASVEKMSRNTAESINDDGMAALSCWRHHPRKRMIL